MLSKWFADCELRSSLELWRGYGPTIAEAVARCALYIVMVED